MQRVKITLSYDGTNFSGWQKQKSRRTVQGEVEAALKKLLGQEVNIVGSSRTDSGVHALGQVAHFDCDFPVENLPKALNSLLPPDVKVMGAKRVRDDFNARFDVVKKTYVYLVTSSDSPIYSRYYTHNTYNILINKVQECLDMFVGRHNFKGFAASGAQVKSYEREIYEAKVTQKKDSLKFTITGNGFLQNMVRILVGTALDVGRGKLSLESVRQALESGDRSKAGKTMPPNGLFLKKIYFRR